MDKDKITYLRNYYDMPEQLYPDDQVEPLGECLGGALYDLHKSMSELWQSVIALFSSNKQSK